jgi:glycosyltransferase involved in cell wall biosynthesis
LNILFVTYNTCARAAKEAKALEESGRHQVVILQYATASEEILYNAPGLVSFYRTRDDLLRRIGYLSDWVEVIHVHNEPNWIVPAAAQARDIACPAVPVIFDVHDLDSQRENGSIDKDEGPAIHAADAYIFPSKAYAKGIRHVWNTQGKPGRVIYSMCNRSDIVEIPLPRIEGIVYEGATVAQIPAFNESTPGYKHYRDYAKLASYFLVWQIPFHLYGVRKDFWRPYLDRGAIVHESLAFPDMLQQLSRYDWGLCGHMDDHPQWQKAMPNKLFEYLAAGIPVISINSDEVSEFVVQHGVGIVAPGLSGLASAARDKDLRAVCAGFVTVNRHKFVMETQVPEIEALYAEAAAYREDRHGPWVQVPVSATGIEACGKWVCFEQPEGAPQDNLGGDQLQPELREPAGNDQKAVQGELYP